MMRRYFCSLALMLAASCQISAAESAAESGTTDEELNQILEGFDEPKKSEPGLDEILQGFEDSAPSKDTDLDEVLQGFDSGLTSSSESPAAPIESRPWELLTLLSLSSSYNFQQQKPAANETDYRGLSRLKVKVQPELRYQFTSKWDAVVSASGFYDFAYRINGRNDYTTQVLDSYESELEIREAYIRGTIGSDFDLTVGRQIVVWGKADSVRVVDVINPLDFREPGMVDIEDLRLPVFMARGDYYFGNWNLSALVIPEIRMSKNPAYGSDFYFGDASKPAPAEEIAADLENQEYGLALKGQFQGWDLSFHWANIYDDQSFREFEQGKAILKHSRINIIGLAGNIAIGNWVFKSEAAIIEGIKFTDISDEFKRTDIMLGFDYSGITNHTLSIEAVSRHLFDYNPALAENPVNTEEDEGQISFRYTGTFLREKLELTGLISLLGYTTEDGAFYRGSLQYELMDAMTMQVGGIVYQDGDSRISQIAARNDRVFIDWRYSF